jgi:hypothetical protein
MVHAYQTTNACPIYIVPRTQMVFHCALAMILDGGMTQLHLVVIIPSIFFLFISIFFIAY